MSTWPAIYDVIRERFRQIGDEGWTPEHDDQHASGEISLAAAAYSLVESDRDTSPPYCWPWDVKWWKPSDRRRNLVKAGALILAEIERIDRAAK